MGLYRDHFKHARYETAEFLKVDKPYANDINYVCDLASIPVEEHRFDAVT